MTLFWYTLCKYILHQGGQQIQLCTRFWRAPYYSVSPPPKQDWNVLNVPNIEYKIWIPIFTIRFLDWVSEYGREGAERDQQQQHGIRGGKWNFIIKFIVKTRMPIVVTNPAIFVTKTSRGLVHNEILSPGVDVQIVVPKLINFPFFRQLTWNLSISNIS